MPFYLAVNDDDSFFIERLDKVRIYICLKVLKICFSQRYPPSLHSVRTCSVLISSLLAGYLFLRISKCLKLDCPLQCLDCPNMGFRIEKWIQSSCHNEAHINNGSKDLGINYRRYIMEVFVYA
ncbi:hypothetical protein CEXT_811571 [Caerostris extrusa]|uniref:Uncharacterized protein n=1 Tax=Caerostris extrusa TaxID=172846 RepID=A0AAV4NZN8_CAEEX|nr:hypothetical protein CEXT_811571 [Caerostris extrusa]